MPIYLPFFHIYMIFFPLFNSLKMQHQTNSFCGRKNRTFYMHKHRQKRLTQVSVFIFTEKKPAFSRKISFLQFSRVSARFFTHSPPQRECIDFASSCNCAYIRQNQPQLWVKLNRKINKSLKKRNPTSSQSFLISFSMIIFSFTIILQTYTLVAVTESSALFLRL